jgi:AcrR family transcriptional regulator
MPPEQRRKSILAVALPLLSWSGESLVMSEVAAAAGVAEATVFKVFPTRDSLILACLESATDTKELEATLEKSRATPSQDLTTSLLAIAEPLREYFLNALRITRAIGSPKANDLASGTKQLLAGIDQIIATEFSKRDLRQNPGNHPVTFELIFISAIYSLATRELADMPVPPMNDWVRALVDGVNPVSKR